MENFTIGQAGILAVLGYAVVFFGLILLMLLIIAIGKAFVLSEQKKSGKAVAPAAPAAPVAAATAPGTAGSIKLNGVEPKTAAMAMAIVADTLGKPINELRFISIKEVTE